MAKNMKWFKVRSGLEDVVSVVILAFCFLACLIGGVLVGVVCGVFRYNPAACRVDNSED